MKIYEGDKSRQNKDNDDSKDCKDNEDNEDNEQNKDYKDNDDNEDNEDNKDNKDISSTRVISFTTHCCGRQMLVDLDKNVPLDDMKSSCGCDVSSGLRIRTPYQINNRSRLRDYWPDQD